MRNQFKMKKSYSQASMKIDNIDFNPKEFRVGSSRISTLPVFERRQSLPNIQIQNKQVYQLKKINQKLKKENEQLKRKLQLELNKKVDQFTREKQQLGHVNASKNYKDYFMNKMNNRSNCPSSTQCQTGLFSSKCLQEPQTIHDLYELSMQNKLDINKLLLVTQRYFQQFQQNYLKLTVMKKSFQCKKTQQIENKRKLQQLLQLFKIPIVFKKNPQLLTRSISKERLRQSKQKNVCLEMKSSQQTIKMLENIVAKIVKSETMLKLAKTSSILKKFSCKIIQ